MKVLVYETWVSCTFLIIIIIICFDIKKLIRTNENTDRNCERMIEPRSNFAKSTTNQRDVLHVIRCSERERDTEGRSKAFSCHYIPMRTNDKFTLIWVHFPKSYLFLGSLVWIKIQACVQTLRWIEFYDEYSYVLKLNSKLALNQH